MNNCARRRDRFRHVRAAEAIERLDLKMLAQGEARVLGQKGVAVVLERMIDLTQRILLLSAHQQLRWRDARQFAEQCLSILQLRHPKLARGQISISETKVAIAGVNRA